MRVGVCQSRKEYLAVCLDRLTRNSKKGTNQNKKKCTFEKDWAAGWAGENRFRCTLDGRGDGRRTWNSGSASRSSVNTKLIIHQSID